MTAPRVSRLPSPGLPASALLCTWLEAVRTGTAGPDDLEETVRGEDPRHLVAGLPGAVELRELPKALRAAPRLALPVAGDPLGLGGPQELNLAALESGEAVVVGDVGLVPELDARTVLWQAYDAAPVPYVDERETAIELRTALSEVTGRLVDLDVASWQPEIPDLLMNLRRRLPLPLPPGLSPRQVETIERAVLCLEIVRLAAEGEGGAVSTYEMGQRHQALTDLDRAARRALVGACSGRD
jgi:hypothetical protein